jgi:hypothetical protein
VVGVFGRQIALLDMPPGEFASAPTWQGSDAMLGNDESIRVALARH